VRGDVTVIEPRQGAAVVELRGEHDLSTQPELSDLLAGLIAGHELVVVDISEATFIDSTFIHGLWLASEELHHMRARSGCSSAPPGSSTESSRSRISAT
jgi:anti-anti-sigma regulatory factor